MSELRKQIDEAVNYIREHTSLQPTIGIVFGTGLGELAKEIDQEIVLSYEDIPHFPISTVETHEGKLIFGKITNLPVVTMQGRFHYYEGYTMQQITFPIRVMKFLGIKTLLILCFFIINLTGIYNFVCQLLIQPSLMNKIYTNFAGHACDDKRKMLTGVH